MRGINSFGGGGDGNPTSKELQIAVQLAKQGNNAQKRAEAIAVQLAEQGNDAQKRAEAIAVQLAKQGNDAQKRAEAIAVQLADAIKGGGDVDYILKTLGGGDRFIFNNFKQIPKNLGEKGFTEPVDLTEGVFPYLNPHTSATDLSRDIIPLDILDKKNII